VRTFSGARTKNFLVSCSNTASLRSTYVAFILIPSVTKEITINIISEKVNTKHCLPDYEFNQWMFWDNVSGLVDEKLNKSVPLAIWPTQVFIITVNKYHRVWNLKLNQ
jgi:hypothetical protein